jgi:amino-acid N-acetyltransferase
MGQRIGSHLVEAAVGEAVKRGAKSVFALTYHPDLFRRQGFKRVTKDLFPQKVWNDCSRCRKRDHCDEIAVLRQV